MILNSTLDLLEFPKVLSLIADLSNSQASSAHIFRMVPLTVRADIETRSRLIVEIRRLSHEGTPLRLYPFSDITQHLAKVRPEGAVLDAVELADFIPVLDIASEIGQTIRDRSDIPELSRLAGSLTGFHDILKTLQKSIDTEGNILDSASFLLSDLRSQIRKLEAKIRKKLEEFTRDEKLFPFLQDDFVTTRSGRWVIPVRMDSKGMVPGVVHDISKSGETAFIEPLGIIQLSNELENLIADHKAEELRILRSICSMIRNVIDECGDEFSTVVYIDVLSSIARFADHLDMEAPLITEEVRVQLARARHPLLQLSLRKFDISRAVVPLDAQLGGDDTVMVITGANAGGKTIAIKTIGLLIVMALSGMPIPAAASSAIPFVSNLLVDIGDEQSIENNLSTFSAHMSNISEILRNRERDTVILIDELGTGTDPDEGAALACSILKNLRKSGALVFATTHLSDIKGFVHRTEGMLNASMEFDQKTFTPLYRLRVGEPGQSHALDIAQRYGIPDTVVQDARTLLGGMKVELDRMISDLNAKRLEYESALRDIMKQRADLEKRNHALAEMVADAHEQKRRVLADAYREASVIIDDAKRQMHAFLDDFKRKEKVERRKTVRRIDEAREIVAVKLREYDLNDMRGPTAEEIRKGDTVFIRSLGYNAQVLDIIKKSKRLKVLARNVEIEVPLTDIALPVDTPPPASETLPKKERAVETASLKVSLVGMRVDEALSRLERFLNDASVADLPRVVIVHGIGKGHLSKAVDEHLHDHPLIKSFRKGTLEEGGAGVTMVEMR